MSEHAIPSFPWNSAPDDPRRYTTDFWTDYFNIFLTTGIIIKGETGSVNAFQVLAKDKMTVTIKAGRAWIKGVHAKLPADLDITLDIADGALPRIDRIVLRCNYPKHHVYIVVKKGDYASTPTPLALQRDGDFFELGIADIHIGRGILSVTQDQIDDLRGNKNLCGFVANAFGNDIDMTALLAQIRSIFDQFMSESQGLRQTQLGAFEAWFDDIKHTLDGDVAGNLLNKINELKERIEKSEEHIVEHTIDIELLKNIIFSNFDGTLFVVTLESLTGITAEGSWNSTKKRVEC